MLTKTEKSSFITFLLACFFSAQVYSQAFCSLRDPLKTIEKFTSPPFAYKSVLVEINLLDRSKLVQETGLEMHHQELGYHTMYIVEDGAGPKGNHDIIHVRPEATPWGLIEMAWLLKRDGSIKDFTYQRCRTDYCHQVEGSEFTKKISSLTPIEMRNLLGANSYNLSEAGRNILQLDNRADPLIAATIRSGLKASVIVSRIGL